MRFFDNLRLKPMWRRVRWLRSFILAIATLLLTLQFSGSVVLATEASVSAPHAPSAEPIPAGASAQFQQGFALYEAGQYEAAIAPIQAAISEFQASGDRAAAAVAMSNLSLIYQRLGRWSAAERAIQQSLDQIDGLEVAPETLASILNIQASLEFGTGSTEAALASWERVESLYRGDDRFASQILDAQIKQAEALRVLGFYGKARSRLESAAQSADGAALSPGAQAQQLRLLGDALRLSGSLSQAKVSLEGSQSLIEQIADPQVQQQQRGATLLSLAQTLQALGQPEALETYDQAIATLPNPAHRLQAEIARLRLLTQPAASSATPAQRDRSNVSLVQAQLRSLFAEVNQLPSSQAGLYSRLALAQTVLERAFDAANHLALEALLQGTVELATTLGDRRSIAYATGTLGAYYEQLSQLEAVPQASQPENLALALDLTQQALLSIQGLNAPDVEYRWNWQRGRLLAQQGRTPAAIAAYDSAIQNLDALRSDLVAVNRELQFSFKESVEPVYRQSVALLTQPEQSKIAEAKNLEKARTQIEALQVAELDNFFREACLDGRAVQIDPLIDQQNPTTALIYPIILDERLEVIVKVPQEQQLRHHAVAIPRAEAEATLRSLQQNLRSPRNSLKARRSAQTVYQWLVEPFKAELAEAEVETLVFVLDGSLRNVPMNALFDGEQYLIEQYAVSVSLGLQLLDPRPLSQTQLNVLAAGLAEPPQPFGELPAVEQELAQIDETGIRNEQVLNEAFTRARLQAELRKARFNVVHIATHGQFSSDAAETFLLAADGPIPVQELDGLLRDRSLLSEEAIELLVLSACQTALGDERAALGIAGVAVKAGARSTLASLWLVDDSSTANLMGNFYQQLAQQDQSLSKAEALRQAQLALLQSDDYSRPYYWAPFVLVGNWL